MAFDVDEQGNLKTLPLLSFEAAVWAEMAPCLRLLLATDQQGTEETAQVVQLTMSVEQASALAGALETAVRQVMVDHLKKYGPPQ